MKQPLVSIIVPTRNSAPLLRDCLDSIQAQTYPEIELIVVDRDSSDETKAIAAEFTDQVYNYGPERSAQVNYGVTQAAGEYVYKVDSDFILEPTVVAECVARAAEGYPAVVVHNTPDTRVSWIAKIRKFEVDMYKYDLTHSSARFVQKRVYEDIGGFNVSITAGEDYDFQNKLNRAGYRTGFVDAEALHLGEPRKFWPHMRKFYDYGRDFVNYKQHNQAESKQQLSFFRGVYWKHRRRFLEQPVTGAMLVGYLICKYGAGALGLATQKLRRAPSL